MTTPRPYFSSGPCVRPRGWNHQPKNEFLLHRSHRCPSSVAFIDSLSDRIRTLAGIPDDYHIAHIPGSGTGAVTSLLMNLLGARPAQTYVNGVFSKRWLMEMEKILPSSQFHVQEKPFGTAFDFKNADPTHDHVLTLNATTAGSCITDFSWVSPDREGLVIADGVSAVFGMELEWSKLDAVAFSWQKCLGLEAGLGTIALSPRAYEHLQTYTPSWQVPHVLALKSGDKVREEMFKGALIGTPSLLTLDEMDKGLDWAEAQGGIKGLAKRAQDNAQAISDYLKAHNTGLDYFIQEKVHRSPLVTVLTPTHPDHQSWDFVYSVSKALDAQKLAYDLNNHKVVPSPSFRMWTGPTLEPIDLSYGMTCLHKELATQSQSRL